MVPTMCRYAIRSIIWAVQCVVLSCLFKLQDINERPNVYRRDKQDILAARRSVPMDNTVRSLQKCESATLLACSVNGLISVLKRQDMRLLPAILQISAFTTNRALLNHFAPTVNGQPLGAGNFRGRNVYTSPGYPVLKPTLSIGVLVAMSLLIGLQLLGLLCLTWYIYHVPSWTGALDAMAMAHIGARLGQQNVLLDGVSGDRDRDARTLQKVNGLIEVVHIEEERDESGTEMQRLRRNSLDQQDGQSR